MMVCANPECGQEYDDPFGNFTVRGLCPPCAAVKRAEWARKARERYRERKAERQRERVALVARLASLLEAYMVEAEGAKVTVWELCSELDGSDLAPPSLSGRPKHETVCTEWTTRRLVPLMRELGYSFVRVRVDGETVLCVANRAWADAE